MSKICIFLPLWAWISCSMEKGDAIISQNFRKTDMTILSFDVFQINSNYLRNQIFKIQQSKHVSSRKHPHNQFKKKLQHYCTRKHSFPYCDYNRTQTVNSGGYSLEVKIRIVAYRSSSWCYSFQISRNQHKPRNDPIMIRTSQIVVTNFQMVIHL